MARWTICTQIRVVRGWIPLRAAGHRWTTHADAPARSALTGEPCRQYAARGGNVCRLHGGEAPQVKAAAKRRLD